MEPIPEAARAAVADMKCELRDLIAPFKGQRITPALIEKVTETLAPYLPPEPLEVTARVEGDRLIVDVGYPQNAVG